MAGQLDKIDGVEADPALNGKLASWTGAHPRTVLTVALLAAAGVSDLRGASSDWAGMGQPYVRRAPPATATEKFDRTRERGRAGPSQGHHPAGQVPDASQSTS